MTHPSTRQATRIVRTLIVRGWSLAEIQRRINRSPYFRGFVSAEILAELRSMLDQAPPPRTNARGREMQGIMVCGACGRKIRDHGVTEWCALVA